MERKYVVKSGGEYLRARSAGYYGDARVQPGEKFFAREGETFGWAVPANIPHDSEPEDAGLLSKPIKDILPALKGLSDASLRALRDEEAGGGNRKSLVNAIDDEIENRREVIDPLT